jgi:hypothetical protein
MRTLRQEDICGYLPHGLEWMPDETRCEITGMQFENYSVTKLIVRYLCGGEWEYDRSSVNGKPILRPLSDLYRSITHNGKDIVPIVECAKISIPEIDWEHNNAPAKNKLYEFGYDCDFGFFCYGEQKYHIENQYQLFDYLNELKIDYRGLVEAGLAIDANTLDINPYK